jgi:hypothetical protein
VDLQDRLDRSARDRLLVVLGVRLVRGAHLDQPRASLGRDLVDPEAAADLDQLAARDHDVSAAGESVDREEQGGGVVVDGMHPPGRAEGPGGWT